MEKLQSIPAKRPNPTLKNFLVKDNLGSRKNAVTKNLTTFNGIKFKFNNKAIVNSFLREKFCFFLLNCSKNQA